MAAGRFGGGFPLVRLWRKGQLALLLCSCMFWRSSIWSRSGFTAMFFLEKRGLTWGFRQVDCAIDVITAKFSRNE